MPYPQKAKRISIRKTKKGDNEYLEKKFWKQLGDLALPWPNIDDDDVQVSQVVMRRSPRGETVRSLLKLLSALLFALAGYGMIKADHELLLKILDLVKYVLGLLAVWALGQTAAHLRK